MKATSLSLPAVILSLLGTGASLAAVSLTASSTQPVAGVNDPHNFVSNAPISGGSYPYNISAYSDVSPGQSFTTPAVGSYSLSSFSLKGSGDMGGLEEATWTISIGTVTTSGITVFFNTIGSFSSIATPESMASTDWLTWTFSGEDVIELQANTVYGIQVVSSTGYIGFAASTGGGSYTGGTAFAASQVGWSEYPNPVDFGYDRTFVVGLSQTIPEPGASTLVLGAAALGLLRKRRK